MTNASVVIPTYNRADTIERAIDSALAQTIADVEVVVVDDASTDDTVSVLDSYGDRIQYVVHDENSGGSAARNTGIAASSGKYVAFLDSDDTWAPSKLETQIRLLEHRGDEWVAAYCDFKQLRSNPLIELIDNVVRRPTGLEGNEEIRNRIFLRTFAHGGASTLIVERDVLEQMDGFDPAFQRHQDLEFLIRLLQIGNLAYVDETLVYKHDTGNPPVSTVVTAIRRFNEKFGDEIRENGLTEEVKQGQRFMVAKYNFRNGEFRKGIRKLRGSTCPHHRDLIAIVLAVITGVRASWSKR